VNGIADTAIETQGTPQVLDGGTLVKLSAVSYELTWNTGETLTVSDAGPYLSVSAALGPQDGPGSMQGLLGSDSGQANDFQLPDGTTLAQPLPIATLLGTFADAWRVPSSASLLDGGSQANAAQITVANTQATPGATSFLSAGSNDQISATAGGMVLTGSATALPLAQAAPPGITFHGDLAGFASDVITNFGAKDFIDITDWAGGSATVLTAGSSAGVLHLAYGGSAADIAFGGLAGGRFQAASDGHGGTLLGLV